MAGYNPFETGDPFLNRPEIAIRRLYWSTQNDFAAGRSSNFQNTSDRAKYGGGFYGNSIGSTLNSGPRYARGTMMGNVPNAGINPNFDRRLAGPNFELGNAVRAVNTLGNGINAVRGVRATNTIAKGIQQQQQSIANSKALQNRNNANASAPAAAAPSSRTQRRAGASAGASTPAPATTTAQPAPPTSPVTPAPSSRGAQRGAATGTATTTTPAPPPTPPSTPVTMGPTRRGMPNQGTPPELNTPGGTGTVPTNWNNMSEHDVDPWAAYIGHSGGPTTQELPVQPTGPTRSTMFEKVKGTFQKLRGDNTPQDRSSEPTTEMNTTEKQDIRAARKASNRYNKEYGPF